RVALPRRDVSLVVTSWSADSALRMTTRARAVTAEADVFTMRRSFKRPRPASAFLRGTSQLGQAAGQQTGDVHLADAEAIGDLGLGQAFEEPEVEDDLLPPREFGDQRRERDPVLDAGEQRVLTAELAGQALVLVVACRTGRVQ